MLVVRLVYAESLARRIGEDRASGHGRNLLRSRAMIRSELNQEVLAWQLTLTSSTPRGRYTDGAFLVLASAGTEKTTAMTEVTAQAAIREEQPASSALHSLTFTPGTGPNETDPAPVLGPVIMSESALVTLPRDGKPGFPLVDVRSVRQIARKDR